jgi:hypothetical protein
VLTPNPSGRDFTVVADSTSPNYNTFGAWPNINDNGAITFYAELNGAASIYKANRNGAPLFIANDGNGAPAINNLGEVASSRFAGAQAELYKSTDGQTFQQIAITGTQFRSFPGFVSLADNSGLAVFYAPLNPVSPTRRGIFTGNGNGATSVVVDNAGAFNDFGGSPTVNDSGTVAFSGSLDTAGVGGIYIGTANGNGATTPVVTTQTAALYNFDGAPFINNNGEIAFLANEQATSAPAVFLVNQDGSNLRRIANASGAFSQMRSPVVNDAGTFVFLANLDNGGRGIFTGPNPGMDKVIAEGDPLFGSTVQSLGFWRGLNNQDEIAFSYTLTDGRSGIARARVIPTADRIANIPRIIATQKVNGKLRVSFASLVGQNYRVQRKTQLSGTTWTTVTAAIAGTGDVVTVEDPGSGNLTTAYYRVVLLP